VTVCSPGTVDNGKPTTATHDAPRLVVQTFAPSRVTTGFGSSARPTVTSATPPGTRDSRGNPDQRVAATAHAAESASAQPVSQRAQALTRFAS
jgi:hypothetical protein